MIRRAQTLAGASDSARWPYDYGLKTTFTEGHELDSKT
jgi:hypothetical protein